MPKNLIPTVFSKRSKVAVHFAAKVTKKHDVEIKMLQGVQIRTPPRASVALKTKRILDAMADNAKQGSLLPIKQLKAEP